MGWMQAAGAGLSLVNGARTARRQDRQATQNIQNQMAIQREINAGINGHVGTIANSSPDQDRTSALGNYLAALKAKMGGITPNLTPTIGSKRFNQDIGASKGRVLSNANKFAELMATVDGAAKQRNRESIGSQNLGVNTSFLARRAEGRANLDQNRLQSIGRNPWMDAFSSIAAGAGKGKGG